MRRRRWRDCRLFVAVAGYLQAMGLSAPRVLEADLERGFLLLTDLGRDPYLLRLEADPQSSDNLYSDAIDALLALQDRGAGFRDQLPPYDEELLRFELSLFREWLCGTHLELEFSDDDEDLWQQTCQLLVDNALGQPQVFVHRDFHSRNLMVLESGNPGILDFQDAVNGPLTYDLVSLLRDCYVSWPAERVQAWALDFRARSPLTEHMSEAQFLREFDLMGVQRQLKAAGIFCRLNHRDGKSGYIDEVPRTLAYILDLEPSHDELGFLTSLIQNRILPAWSRTR